MPRAQPARPAEGLAAGRQVHGADDDSIRFAGRSQIGELMLLGERIYDPAVGRFLSPDPVLQTVASSDQLVFIQVGHD